MRRETAQSFSLGGVAREKCRVSPSSVARVVNDTWCAASCSRLGAIVLAMVSLLDIIGPVMVGPSSSHTAGACRLGLLARGLVGGTPRRGAARAAWVVRPHRRRSRHRQGARWRPHGISPRRRAHSHGARNRRARRAEVQFEKTTLGEEVASRIACASRSNADRIRTSWSAPRSARGACS